MLVKIILTRIVSISFLISFLILSINVNAQEDCIIKFDGKQNGKHITELQEELMFVNTPDFLEKYFTEFPLLECRASIYSLRGSKYLMLQLKVNAKTAEKDFGDLDKGSMVRFNMMHGEEVFLLNEKHTNPDPFKGSKESYLYIAHYAIPKGKDKILRDDLIESIGIEWDRGYREYDAINVDFFRNQLACLK